MGWVVETFRAWSDWRGDIERGFTKDERHFPCAGLVGHPGSLYTHPATPPHSRPRLPAEITGTGLAAYGTREGAPSHLALMAHTSASGHEAAGKVVSTHTHPASQSVAAVGVGPACWAFCRWRCRAAAAAAGGSWAARSRTCDRCCFH